MILLFARNMSWRSSTYQPYSPIGLHLELLKRPLNTPKDPVRTVPGASWLEYLQGAASEALGPAYRAIRLIGYIFSAFARLP